MGHFKRIPIFAANWKMNKTAAETRDFFSVFLPAIDGILGREVVVAPPFTALAAASQMMRSGISVSLASQNMYFEREGAFTGEVSPVMLKEFGVRWVILGHSERRHIFGEDDRLIARKVRSALDAGLKPMLCIGEKLDEREAGLTFEVLDRQISSALAEIDQGMLGEIALAYEPVWAIGTGRAAALDQIQDVHSHIRSYLGQNFNSTIADGIRIMYGGSVNLKNVEGVVAMPDVDGVLVGGASLDPKKFADMVRCKIG
ncbi:MAG: triose-phosphate isomerase [Dissulfurimicrobium sp.]|uniref:triose-phosphate isomerase n=1 Tax=Dissulfurimicrobium TaxID=1769732 RepID=UPI001EDA9F37|nr:triose-phosphate isomerase [Dissulfurimicrobium hydrothermale]UKL13504.1 triose-phosphate isomerase [Dissulfurimicrobium hydrothermale]